MHIIIKDLYLSIWLHKLNQTHTIKQKRWKNWSPLKHCWQKFYTIKMVKYFDVWKINNDRKFESNKHYWNSSNENFDRFLKQKKKRIKWKICIINKTLNWILIESYNIVLLVNFSSEILSRMQQQKKDTRSIIFNSSLSQAAGIQLGYQFNRPYWFKIHHEAPSRLVYCMGTVVNSWLYVSMKSTPWKQNENRRFW